MTTILRTTLALTLALTGLIAVVGCSSVDSGERVSKKAALEHVRSIASGDAVVDTESGDTLEMMREAAFGTYDPVKLVSARVLSVAAPDESTTFTMGKGIVAFDVRVKAKIVTEKGASKAPIVHVVVFVINGKPYVQSAYRGK